MYIKGGQITPKRDPTRGPLTPGHWQNAPFGMLATLKMGSYVLGVQIFRFLKLNMFLKICIPKMVMYFWVDFSLAVTDFMKLDVKTMTFQTAWSWCTPVLCDNEKLTYGKCILIYNLAKKGWCFKNIRYMAYLKQDVFLSNLIPFLKISVEKWESVDQGQKYFGVGS